MKDASILNNLDELYEKNNFSGYDRQKSQVIINTLIKEIKRLKETKKTHSFAGRIPNCS